MKGLQHTSGSTQHNITQFTKYNHKLSRKCEEFSREKTINNANHKMTWSLKYEKNILKQLLTIFHEAMENTLESNGKKFPDPPTGYKNRRKKQHAQTA